MFGSSRRPAHSSSGSSRKPSAKPNFTSKSMPPPPLPRAKVTSVPPPQPPQTYLSFIFIINPLPTHEEPTHGGVEPRLDPYDLWVPPVNPRAYTTSPITHPPGVAYRWAAGTITRAPYTWYTCDIIEPEPRRGTLVDMHGQPLEYFGAASVFYCNPFIHYLACIGDASTRSLDPEVVDEQDGWFPLTFYHDRDTPEGAGGVVTYLDHIGADKRQMGNPGSARMVPQLLPEAYDWRPYANVRALEEGVRADEVRPPEGGLAGFLPILLSLVAFTCNRSDLEKVLCVDRAWRDGRWRGHGRLSGRRERRGMVCSVFLDPENPLGSTEETVYNFEFHSGAIFR